MAEIHTSEAFFHITAIGDFLPIFKELYEYESPSALFLTKVEY